MRFFLVVALLGEPLRYQKAKGDKQNALRPHFIAVSYVNPVPRVILMYNFSLLKR